MKKTDKKVAEGEDALKRFVQAAKKVLSVSKKEYEAKQEEWKVDKENKSTQA